MNSEIQNILDAGSVIPDLIRDRHDAFGAFCEAINVWYGDFTREVWGRGWPE
ncbi:MAG: hypothetical protein PVH37_12685 [Desulfobacterales bacterium]